VTSITQSRYAKGWLQHDIVLFYFTVFVSWFVVETFVELYLSQSADTESIFNLKFLATETPVVVVCRQWRSEVTARGRP